MNTIKSFLFVFLSLSLIGLSFQKHSCIHDHMEKRTLEVIPHEEVDVDTANHRFLATTTTTTAYGPIRIHLDYTYLSASADVVNYIKNKLLPAAVSYWTSTLQVSQLSKLSVATTRTTICGLNTPSVYYSGVAADIVLFVTGQTTSESWVAWAQACSLLSGTNRPIFGQINFNYNNVGPSTGVAFEGDLMSTLHEMTHALGFSSSLFPYFTTKPVISTHTATNGNTYSYLDVAPLTAKLRTYFGCTNLVGAYMEQQGGAGSAGSHFERRIFMNEYMTASEISDARITQFSLALLEGTGWYKVNYNMAEPFFWGKGKGCSFVDGQCVSSTTKQANFDEYCSTTASYGCTFHGRAGGYCGNTGVVTDASLASSMNYFGDKRVVSDSFADNCPYVAAYANIDCIDPNSASRAIISSEVYGEGSKCFMGTLYPTGTLSRQYQYCLQYNCVKQTSGAYYLQLIFGKTVATCTKEGSIKVTGYSGTIDCPDPQEYCTTVGVKYCPRGCLGRGTCGSDAKCKCNAGWTGNDCGTPATASVQREKDVNAPLLDKKDIIPDKKK